MSWRLREINKKMEDLKTFFAKEDLVIDVNNVQSVLRKFLELKAIMKEYRQQLSFLGFNRCQFLLEGKTRH